MNVSVKEFFKNINLFVPQPQEQQKIASCLSSLDELIATHQDKLEALKEHKKGLMQNLFPQEGETVPKVRFPEFEGDGEWKSVRLKQILMDNRLGGNYENKVSGNGVPLIKMGNILRGSIDIKTLSFLPKESEYGTDDILQFGDLLFNTRNTLDLVGKVAIWRGELDFALYNSNLMRLSFKPEVINSNFFMNYLFNTGFMVKKIRSLATGTTSVAAVYTKDLINLELSICGLQEQRKIATCLSTLDELISAQTEKIEQLQQHKKGLMQGLFPEVNN